MKLEEILKYILLIAVIFAIICQDILYRIFTCEIKVKKVFSSVNTKACNKN